MRPFLPPLLAGALARADAGLDFDRTDYAFLESAGFLVAVLALAVLSYALDRARRPSVEDATGAAPRPLRRDPVAVALACVAVALGGLLFAGSLAAGGLEGWPGLVAGAGCALLGLVAASALLSGARRRLDPPAAALLPMWADAGALTLAAVAILFPPAALVGIAVLAYLLLAIRRERSLKYEGLRILR